MRALTRDAWCVISEQSGPASFWDHRPQIRSPIRYNLITKVITTKCFLHSFLRYLSVFVFFFVSVSFLVYLHDLKPKKSHARRSRTIIVRPFAFPFPASVSLAFFFHTHTLSRLHAQFAVTHICVCVCIFIYYINRRHEKRWQWSRQ